MGNMSYCRFENTLNDLRDCAEHIEDTGLSEDEHHARKRMLVTCRRILEAQVPTDAENKGDTNGDAEPDENE